MLLLMRILVNKQSGKWDSLLTPKYLLKPESRTAQQLLELSARSAQWH